MPLLPNIIVGDCLDSLRKMPSESVHCCVTSPPYFGLRDYGVAGQLGAEATPEEFVISMVTVFKEVRRVLRDDGVLFLNIGDSYYNHRTGHGGGMPGQTVHGGRQNGKPDKKAGCLRRATKLENIQEKELIGIPWMLAFALRSDGWLIRQEIIWSKPNPTPEKVTDRFTRSHEQIFLLTKRSHYAFDSTVVMESGIEGRPRRKRSVWEVKTARAGGAHFATFPPALIEPCILAGSPAGGLVLDPFGGAGTTGLVAMQHGRNSILCELNPEYAALAEHRISDSIASTDMIYLTDYNPDTLACTSASADSGFSTFDEVRQLMGEPQMSHPRMLTYPGGVCFTDFELRKEPMPCKD